MLNAVGDDDAAQYLIEIAAKAHCSISQVKDELVVRVGQPSNSTKAIPEFSKWAKQPSKSSEDQDVLVWLHREKTHLLRKLQKELIGRFRSKRYFEGVRNFQRGNLEAAGGLAILSCCGHQGPIDEVKAAVKTFKCIKAPACGYAARDTHVVAAESLGSESESGHFGIKLERLVDCLEAIPKGDRIIVFVQFPELLEKVHQALDANNIHTAVLNGTAKALS
jgi:SNF2 family DNA or RNA helicase